jgi:solute carrier family 13 (sodium-dependent dicarboxylate transporter), member 2/3/5
MKTKAFEWLIRSLLAAVGLQGVPMMWLLVLFMGLTIFSHAIWSTTTAMAGVMIPIYIGVAQTLKLDVVGFVMPLAILMAYALFLPFNTMGNIILFGAGHYTVSDQVKSSVVIGLASWVLWVATAFTWWRIIGLL